MSDGGILGVLWQTVWTMWRQWRVRCPWCAERGRKSTLESVVTSRGYVLRCWQCGGEYVERLERVWP